MDTEDGEFTVCGAGGTTEDAKFDDLVGVIEDFMANFDTEAVFRRLPPFASVSSDHERYGLHKELIAQKEAELDAYVLEHCESIASVEDATSLLSSRSKEIADEVWDFITEGCFDYTTFAELWKQHSG
ncbi:putative ARF-like 2-binding protein [Trypanosoma conorhini]|uniref:Putative ARF-like 2-binding protein n=1 Tax=Trypanosoma conorhini TaxID=83891 RepID=A0A422Q949_9TRYP|nr:putative ARF-like 2-binding protein [Trypanosoma conorhini]RNF26457.1 putative ARF-like 2-binding protein [Trypanosoma conorhini]